MRYPVNNNWKFKPDFKEEYINSSFLGDEIMIPHTVKELPFNYFNIEDYEITYDAEVDPQSAELLSDLEVCDYLFVIFNTNRPRDFKGHSLSVSDLIHLESDGTCRLYYCESFGWKKIKECRS